MTDRRTIHRNIGNCRECESGKSAARGESDYLATSIVTLVDDLFFVAKIQEAARTAGVAVHALDARGKTAGVAEARPQAVLLDLNARSFSSLDWIRALKSDPATSSIRIIGFVSHVQEQLISEARAAGCDTIMARSAFSKQLPDLLRGLAPE